MKTETMVSMTLAEYENLIDKNRDLTIQIMALEQDIPKISITEYTNSSFVSRKRYDYIANVDKHMQAVMDESNKLSQDVAKLEFELRSKIYVLDNAERTIKYLQQELDDYKSTFFYKLHNKIFTRWARINI